jgi:hypothetical protein
LTNGDVSIAAKKFPDLVRANRMSDAVQRILGAALPLSSTERAEIAALLLQSLRGDKPTAAEELAIESRVQDLRNGLVTPIPGDEAAEHVLASLKDRDARQ